MKMPPQIPVRLIAPCGIDCLLCHHHCEDAAPCEGCRDGKGKSSHCRACGILSCARKKEVSYCAECGDFPCEKLFRFNAFYIKRYGHEFLPNARLMKA